MIAYNNPKAVSLAMIGTTFLVLTTLTTVSVSAQDVGCCSHDFKTCAEWCTDVTDSTQCGTCESEEYGTLLIWLDQPMDSSTCVPRWDECTHAPTDGTCCPDLVCYQRSVGYSQCLHPLDIEELERSASPTTDPSPSPTAAPSKSPTSAPTTENPTPNPTSVPSAAPSDSPTSSPTNVPTQSLSSAPSAVPSNSPTVSPSKVPSAAPSSSPTNLRSNGPTSSEIDTNTQNLEINEQTKESTWKELLWLWILLLILGGILICAALVGVYVLSRRDQNDKVSDDNDNVENNDEQQRKDEEGQNEENVVLPPQEGQELNDEGGVEARDDDLEHGQGESFADVPI